MQLENENILDKLFSRGKKTVYAVGGFSVLAGIPLVVLILQVGVGWLLAMPSFAIQLGREAGGDIGVIAVFFSLGVAIFAWMVISAAFGKKASIISGIILAIVNWQVILIAVCCVLLLAILMIPVLLMIAGAIFVVVFVYELLRMLLEHCLNKKSSGFSGLDGPCVQKVHKRR